MGIDFAAIIPHHTDVAGLRALLNELDRLNREIVRWWPPSCSGIPGRPWTFNPVYDIPWYIDSDVSGHCEAEALWEQGHGVWVRGSRLFQFRFNRHAITFSGTGDRWSLFREHADHRLFVRRVCRALARVFQTDRALYVPDAYLPASGALSIISSNATFQEAEAWLRDHCGPPADSADEIVRGDEVQQAAGTYFIDHFAALSQDG